MCESKRFIPRVMFNNLKRWVFHFFQKGTRAGPLVLVEGHAPENRSHGGVPFASKNGFKEGSCISYCSRVLFGACVCACCFGVRSHSFRILKRHEKPANGYEREPVHRENLRRCTCFRGMSASAKMQAQFQFLSTKVLKHLSPKKSTTQIFQRV